MANKTLDEMLTAAKASAGEASTTLPTLKDVGDYATFTVAQVMVEKRYRDETRTQTNLAVDLSAGVTGGQSIPPGRYKLYMGSSVLDRIVHQYGFRPGDKVALVLQREVQTGKATAMKDFAVEITDAQGRDVKRNYQLQLERTTQLRNDQIPF